MASPLFVLCFVKGTLLYDRLNITIRLAFVKQVIFYNL